jgi:hypothetical protein
VRVIWFGLLREDNVLWDLMSIGRFRGSNSRNFCGERASLMYVESSGLRRSFWSGRFVCKEGRQEGRKFILEAHKVAHKVRGAI